MRAARRLWALAVALLAGCVHDVHRIGPIAAPSPPLADPVRVLVFGDYGYRTVPQWLVARALRRVTAERGFDLAVQLGDNVYFCGPDPLRTGAETCRFEDDGRTVAPGALPPDDPLFSQLNESRLQGLRGRDGRPLPTYLVLGNHDVGLGGGRCVVAGLSERETMRRRACLEVARETPTWKMPARSWVLDRGPVRIIGIDTNVAVRDYGGFTLEQEIAFLREASAECGAGRVCFVAGHHPPARAMSWLPGRGGAPPPFQERIERLLAAADGRARAFFGGHVHTLQHLTLDGLEVFISGSTAMGSFSRFRFRIPGRAQLRFASTAWGYAVLEASAEGYRVEYFDFQGVALHCCRAGATGPCEPVACR